VADIPQRGKDGRDGRDGARGFPGLDGQSAYELACDAGFRGSPAEYLASLRGLDGQDVDREQLAADVREQVRRSVDEIPRPLNGKDGKDGAPGEPGPRGQKGADGRDGKDGRDATAPPAVPWAAVFQRDALGKTLHVDVRSADASLQAWRITPSHVDGLMASALISPI
jgi:hypothetical protein